MIVICLSVMIDFIGRLWYYFLSVCENLYLIDHGQEAIWQKIFLFFGTNINGVDMIIN